MHSLFRGPRIRKEFSEVESISRILAGLKPTAALCKDARTYGTASAKLVEESSCSNTSERPEDHPLLRDPRFPRPISTLTAGTRILTLLAAHVAKGDLDGVKEDWQHLPVSEQKSGIEIVLQTFLFGGMPRTINALAAIRSIDSRPDIDNEDAESETPADFARKGEELNREIYGKQYESLRERVAVLHPDLDHWMIEIAYGRVLARPGPTLKQRELCLVSVLAGMHCDPQLVSHIRGSIHAGATLEELRTILNQTMWVWGRAAQMNVDAVWTDFTSRQHRTLNASLDS